MAKNTFISSNPINEAVLIDPRSGQVIGKGSTPTGILNERLQGGKSLTKSPQSKEDQIKALEEQLQTLKDN